MFSYIWPVGLVVLSNIFYHICAKKMPGEVNPFAALIVTYLVGIVCAVVLYFATGGGGITKEFSKMNWVPYVLGIVIVGLEAGNIYSYKAGWAISTQAIVQSSLLAIALILVGYLLFKEVITWNKIMGVVICMVGLFFINMK